MEFDVSDKYGLDATISVVKEQYRRPYRKQLFNKTITWSYWSEGYKTKQFY